MKKKLITLALIAVSSAAIGFAALAVSVTPSAASDTKILIHTHASAQGKHCTGTVGCDCTGFAPVTNGKEWQKSYCRKCSHHKNSHR